MDMTPINDRELIALVRRIAADYLDSEGWYVQASRVHELCDRFERLSQENEGFIGGLLP